MCDREALDLYIRMLKGEDVLIETQSMAESKALFERVAYWAEKGASFKISAGYHLIARPRLAGYIREEGSLRVTP